MNKPEAVIPQTTIKVVAKSFFKEMAKYGFQQIDYLRFCNAVLDLSLQRKTEPASTQRAVISHEHVLI